MAVSYNIKTGADTSCYFSREVTQSDTDHSEANLGLIKDSVEQDTDYYEYPTLVRRTGDSLAGTTDNIESNELRKGRTKSAPRKGNSSSEGSLDFELSPETYDDILEAALRDKFKTWESDTKSPSNLDGKTFALGKFATKKMEGSDVKDDEKQLLGATGSGAVIEVPASELANYEIAELNCGTQDIRYDVVKQFGGVEGEDLYQDFEHLCVNSVDMSVTPGQIVTGSFSFMGSNNPDLLPKEVEKKFSGDGTAIEFTITDKPADLNYVKVGDAEITIDGTTNSYNATTGKLTFGTAPAAGTDNITVSYNGAVKVLTGRFKTSKDRMKVSQWLDNLPKKGTSTDQYTAQQGFLYINGERVRYGSNLSFSLNNGLSKTFAIFEKDAIAMSPLTLDITGSLSVYLIKGYAEKLYNMCTGDKDVEVLFCFQDKEENPENLYVVQIFKTKFTSADMSSGAENLEVSLPIQSFEERAMRIFRLRKRKPLIVTAGAQEETGGDYTLPVTAKLSTLPSNWASNKAKVTYKVGTADEDEIDMTSVALNEDAEHNTIKSFTVNIPCGTLAALTSVEVTVEYNGNKLSKKFEAGPTS